MFIGFNLLSFLGVLMVIRSFCLNLPHLRSWCMTCYSILVVFYLTRWFVYMCASVCIYYRWRFYYFLGNVDEEPTSVTGRKDSLSINLEFVKVSLSRIRRSGGASFFESQSGSKSTSKMDTTLINISGIQFCNF